MQGSDMSNNKIFRKIVCKGIGPGGWKCACCAPAPGSKARKALFRNAKRRFKDLARKEIFLKDDYSF